MEGACDCGAVRWRFDGVPDHATACNCTICRRYGVLWAYDYEGHRISVAGATAVHTRLEGEVQFNFCPGCGCVAFWRAASLDDRRRRRMAVNLRLAEPAEVAAIPVEHLDGLESWESLVRDSRTVGDLWF